MERVVFTEEMKKTHTILVPTMLPIHFNMMVQIMRQHGYKADLLTNDSHAVIDQGLRNVHNDTCYPALLVIGQMIDALESGKYDLHKVALLITQTGGGCRASNYIHLLRKALQKSGYGYIPVISLSFTGLESNPGFKITLPMAIQLVNAVFLGDLLTDLQNQCLPYEIEKGDTAKKVTHWENYLCDQLGKKKYVSRSQVRKWYDEIIKDFASIPKRKEKKVKVGVVGEIYVKYSPLGNNNLEAFLLQEGAEVVVPGLMGFCLYCVYNTIEDRTLYGGEAGKAAVFKMIYNYLTGREKEVIDAVKKEGSFRPSSWFPDEVKLAEGYISHGVKMGEGWLLTAEIVSLVHEGIENVVCTQPFGCLPNHIVGKGMIRTIKEKNPNANIVAVDYDPGASAVNQQNRIKLMLANAQKE